jgi:hypothetical protein
MLMSRHTTSIIFLCLMVTSSGLCAGNSGNEADASLKAVIVEVNHVFLFLQQSSIDSIARTPFIREHFSAFEQSEVNAGSESWSGTYLIGQQTYLELFPAGGELEETDKSPAGIGLNTRQEGQFQSFKASLLEHAGDHAEDGLRVRVFDQDTVSWFYWTSLKESDSCLLSTWLMEFTDEYLDRKGIGNDSSRIFSRHDYLMAKSAESNAVPTSSTMFDDIVSIDLELTRSEYSDFKLLADAFGIKSTLSADSSSFIFGNCDVNVQINEKRTYLVRKIVCSLTRAAEPQQQIIFGPDASLEVSDSLAIWHFGS